MLTWLIRRRIDAFEREYDYDMDYARDLLETSRDAMIRFHRATALGAYRESLPMDAWHACRLAAIQLEDCGPCTQLIATMAERDGQPSDMIRSVLNGRVETQSADVQLAVAFTHSVLRREPEMSALREEVLARFGRQGLVSLAFAMLSCRLYPTLKYALGYGHACSVVEVGGAAVHAAREAN